MQKLVTFLEKSVQWVVLGLAGVFLLLCAYWFLLTPVATTKVAGKIVTPGEIDPMTHDGPVALIENDIRHGQPEAIHVPDLTTQWKKQMEIPSAIPFAAYAMGSTPGERVRVINTEGGNTDLITAVASLPKATPVSAQGGLSVAAPLNGANGQVVQGAVAFDVLWASAAFSIPAADLKAAFEKPLERKPADYAKFYRTAFLSIELQRQRAIGHDAAGTPIFPDDNKDVTRVEIPKINQNDIQPLPDAKAAPETKSSFSQWAETNELSIRQPKFYTITAGSPYSPAVLLGQPAAPGAAAAAPVIPAKLQPPAMGGANPAGGNAQQVGIDPLTLTTDQLVWHHDDTVEAGRTYRYRVVYHLKNPVYALEHIADPKIIDQLDIASPPSDWSGPITIPPNVQYWVKSLQRNGAALVDYFKWEGGSWHLTKDMSLSPGDTVPGTDQTLVDIHNVPGPRVKDQFVLLTDASGEVIRHFPKTDRDDGTYKDLQKQTSPDAAGAAGAGRGGAAPAGTPPRPTTPPRSGAR